MGEERRKYSSSLGMPEMPGLKISRKREDQGEIDRKMTKMETSEQGASTKVSLGREPTTLRPSASQRIR